MTTWGPGPAGFALGFVVAAQVGPVWLLCARTSLRHGLRAGLAVGLGAATVDLMYACLGVAGAAGLLRLTGLRVGLGLLGAAVLVFLGARTLWSAFRIRAGGEAPDEVATPGAALRTSWAAVFTATSTAQLTTSPLATAQLLVGVAVGSMAWFAALAVTLRLVGHRIGPRGLRAVDLVAGAGLVAYGGVLAVRSVGEPA
jgi:threonine/homoserine/homoserine lactone efflux protein